VRSAYKRVGERPQQRNIPRAKDEIGGLQRRQIDKLCSLRGRYFPEWRMAISNLAECETASQGNDDDVHSWRTRTSCGPTRQVRVMGFLDDVRRTKLDILFRAIDLMHIQGVACEFVAAATVGEVSKIGKFKVVFENNTPQRIGADTSADARFRLVVCQTIARNSVAPRR
jgi:hypothetical protein